MMRTLDELKKVLQDNKEGLNTEYGVIEIGIFGSYIRNEHDQTSDIDLLVEFRKTVDLITFVHLKNHLSDLLGVDVDLVMKKALKPKIGQRILSEATYI